MKILYTIKDIYIFIDKNGDWAQSPIPIQKDFKKTK
jgi:hypothetical protein